MATEYGSRLKAARMHAKLTQVQLSEQTGIPQSTISTAENSGHGSTETIAYATACGVYAHWLATGEGEMTDQPVEGLVLNTPSSPAQRLRHARKSRGLSQVQLAEKACVAQGTVGNIEAGTRGIKSSSLELARALEVSPEWLAFGTGEMEIGASTMATANGSGATRPATLDQALAVLVQWAMKADDLSRDQIRLLVSRIFDEPHRGAEIIARVVASVDLTV